MAQQFLITREDWEPSEIRFFGKVYPTGLNINAYISDVHYDSGDGSLSGNVEVIVQNSDITVSWRKTNVREEILSQIYVHSRKLAAAVVNLIAFRMGAAATVFLHEYEKSGKNRQPVVIAEFNLPKLVTTLSDDKAVWDVFRLVIDQQHLMTVLEDLIAGLWSQEHKVINCARSIEAIRKLMSSPDLSLADQWKSLREALNVDRPYLEAIMFASTDPRHGGVPNLSSAHVDPIVSRTWTVIDRYFRYRLGGSLPLDQKAFPILRG